MKTLSKKTEKLLEIVKKTKPIKQTTLTGKPRTRVVVFGKTK